MKISTKKTQILVITNKDTSTNTTGKIKARTSIKF